MGAHPARTVIVAAVGLALLGGCGTHPPSHSGGVRQLKKSEMTPAELKYGIAPVPDASVTYQPDVVIVGGGGESIRAQSTNGFVWTIDASAPRAADLAPGKIFFMTNRAVGRVLDVHREGANLVLVVGPVNLTDVVQEAHLTIKTPVDFTEAIPYASPDLPGRVDVIARRNASDDATITPVGLLTESGTTDQQAAPATPDVSNLVNFTVQPIANRFGLGLEASTDAGGLKLYTRATLHMAAPTFDAHIDISKSGTLNQASLSLTGGAGLTWKFAVGTDIGRRANVNGILTPDTDFSIPIGGLGPLPIALTVRQRLVIKTALGVRNTTLSATGDYTFSGAFNVGVVNRQWTINGPTNFTTQTNMMKTADGISLGASGIDLTDEVKVIAGIGVHGFAAGPYFRVVSALGVFKGSSLGMIPCKAATVDVKLSGGVGYVIPKVVTNLFNSILRGLNIKYQIDGEGGFNSGAPLTLYSDTTAMKGCNAGKE